MNDYVERARGPPGCEFVSPLGRQEERYVDLNMTLLSMKGE
jgi:hypothetical protein